MIVRERPALPPKPRSFRLWMPDTGCWNAVARLNPKPKLVTLRLPTPQAEVLEVCGGGGGGMLRERMQLLALL